MLITQQHIATEAKVSRSTVAAVMSEAQSDRISPEVRGRVMAAAEKLGYRPNRYAQVMRNGKSGMIGIIDFGGLNELSQRKVLAAAEAILREKYEPMVQESLWFSKTGGDEGESACQRMIDSRVEGVILVHPSVLFKQEYLEQLLKAGIPVVGIAGPHLCGIPSFQSDREWGYYAMALHLLKLGYRHLAVLSNVDLSARRGVERAVKEHSGDVKTDLYFPELKRLDGTPRQAFSYLRGKTGMRQILDGKVLPEAVMCSNDEWAHGALTACFDAGLTVPGDIALTGFDNAVASEFGAVPITTMAQPITQISEQAVECLLEMVNKGKSPQSREIKFRGELIVRGSCGARLLEKPRDGSALSGA